MRLADVRCSDGNAMPNASQGAFPLMVQHLLPPGLRGIVVAGLLSALMGSLAGVFNACSTLFTVDIYEKWRPGATQSQIVRMGRTCHHRHGAHRDGLDSRHQGRHGLYNYLQSVQGYLAPPIFVVFFFGVFKKRLNAQGLPLGDGRGLRHRHLPADRRHARDPGPGRLRARLCGGIVPLDCATTSISSTTACSSRWSRSW